MFSLYTWRSTWLHRVAGYDKNPIHFNTGSYMLSDLHNKLVVSQSCWALIHEREAALFQQLSNDNITDASVFKRIPWPPAPTTC